MEAKIQNSKAREIIAAHIEECSYFLDTNNVNLEIAKQHANDWYQKLIADLNIIFYEPQEFIDEMNEILAKEHPHILRFFYPSITGENYYKKTDSFNNKVKGIIAYLENLKNSLQ